MHECKQNDKSVLKVQELNSQIENKDRRIERLNMKIWDLENKYDIKIQEHNSRIQRPY